MQNLNIVFMGTPDFAVESLKILVENGCRIAAVITAPDKPAGRGRKLQQSAVKQYAITQNLKVLQPTNLKDPEFLSELRALNANLQVVVAFRMLPAEVWKMPEFGTFNLHASLLPDYRGAAPINWAIMNGETVTGVTTFFIDDKIDTGEIIMYDKTEITPEDNAGTLHDKLMTIGARLVLKTVQAISENKLSPQKQHEPDEHKKAEKIYKDTCRIDWDRPIKEIYNHIRGLSPYPGAWTTIEDQGEEISVKILAARAETTAQQQNPKKLIVDKNSLKVTVKEGYIHLLEVQLPGKRKMAVTDLLNGHHFGSECTVN
ncbi:methionyl-tRNA formyltransferase [Sinomicrobium sp.]